MGVSGCWNLRISEGVFVAVIHTVLFDADGVLQAPSAELAKRWGRYAIKDGREALAEELFRIELPSLAGQGRIEDAVERFVAERGLPAEAVEDILAGWASIDVFAESFALVDAVRAAGVKVHLASNQQSFRRDVMLGLGYADHFDELFFSCDLGVAKPSAEYFRRLLDRLGIGPEGVLFIDDRADNVAAARQVGLAARVHARHDSPDQGIGDLVSLLREEGLVFELG
nr:HAD-IA family hydrolase [Dermatophilus congolensis]